MSKSPLELLSEAERQSIAAAEAARALPPPLAQFVKLDPNVPPDDPVPTGVVDITAQGAPDPALVKS